jgi:single-strand DNA-binding protein
VFNILEISEQEETVMRNFNLAVLEGRLVGDPELRYTQNGTALCRFSIANNHDYYKDDELQKEVSYIDVTTWAKLAEQCNEYLNKGSRVIINGRLRQSRWQDEDGGNHSKVGVVGNQVQFLDLKNGTGDDAPGTSDPDGDQLY